MKDLLGRKIEYMRISVTDRCDLRCRYCMPAEGVVKVDKSEILGYEEIVEVCKAAIALGITKFKITGGEPLVRYDLIRLLRAMRELPGLDEITMTTNGQQLSRYIDEIAEIGIDGINISLDSLKADKYRYISRTGEIENVLQAVDLSISKGIKTKLNCLLQRGFNDDEMVDMIEYAMDKGIDIRFIELMPIGIADKDMCYSSEETMKRITEAYPDIVSDGSRHGNGPAVYYKLPGRKGSIGIISSVSGGFCETCNRVRLTSKGYLKPCLCYDSAKYIRPYISQGEDALIEALREGIESKPEGHCFADISRVDHHAMSEIGG